MKTAIVGTRGIPNNYGGFETLAEYLVKYLAKDLDITVYCSSKDIPTKLQEYNGAKLKYIPITSHGASGILYDSLSLLSAVRQYDKILFLGFGGGFVMPFLKRYSHKIIVNIGGLDWKRDKWSHRAQKVIKQAEKYLIKYSGEIISDNKGIQEYILNEYGRESTFIAYGGDQAEKVSVTEKDIEAYPFLSSPYAFIVTRIQSDNNITMLLDAFDEESPMPLVIVGNWNSSPYGITTKATYQGKSNLYLLDAIYDQNKLNLLRSNCTLYLHGHSAGGTNPSLVEAMNLGLPVYAYASGYNENTTFNKAKYFHNSEELRLLVNNYRQYNLSEIGSSLKDIAQTHYKWDIVAKKYKEIFIKK
jgi:glycosyltransferase involved in cell wall biosynthesis